ncbi:MAG: ribonuclease III [Verrucomicrobia bacterium]|nr:ribonuclease III [Verrucomicrobiota bacterium]
MEKLWEDTSGVEEKIKYTFKDKKLLVLAFIHRSFYNENRELVPGHNERLEFLGDSVLGLMISDYLYKHLPTEAEGELSHLRAHLVEATSCVRYLHKLDLEPFVLLGRGEQVNVGKGRETILADLFEALIGAIYLDSDLETVTKFFWKHFEKDVKAMLKTPSRNWKAELQDYSQRKFQRPPHYVVQKEEGPDHNKVFYVVALLDGEEMGAGSGSTKKQAEQAAAEDALRKMEHG